MVRPLAQLKVPFAAVAAVAVLLAGCATFDEPPPPRPPSEPPEERPEPDDTGWEWPGEPEPLPEPEPVREQHPRHLVEVSGPAVVSLHQQAEQESSAGRHDNAVAVLERALRIEPRNPFLWSALAEAHLAAGHHAQAENSAVRANSLARGNPWLESRNWGTIAGARRANGDAAGARDAADRAESARLRIQEL